MMAEFEARLRDGAKQQDRVQAVAQPLPVVVGELGDYLDGFASSKYHRVINAQLHEYAAGAPARACVTARDLPHKGDHPALLGTRSAHAGPEICRRMAWRCVAHRPDIESTS